LWPQRTHAATSHGGATIQGSELRSESTWLLREAQLPLGERPWVRRDRLISSRHYTAITWRGAVSTSWHIPAALGRSGAAGRDTFRRCQRSDGRTGITIERQVNRRTVSCGRGRGLARRR